MSQPNLRIVPPDTTIPGIRRALMAMIDAFLKLEVAAGITQEDVDNWNAAFGWGDHHLMGYLTEEEDPAYWESPWGELDAEDKAEEAILKWFTAYAWGDHSQAGYLKADGSVPVVGNLYTIPGVAHIWGDNGSAVLWTPEDGMIVSTQTDGMGILHVVGSIQPTQTYYASTGDPGQFGNAAGLEFRSGLWIGGWVDHNACINYDPAQHFYMEDIDRIRPTDIGGFLWVEPGTGLLYCDEPPPDGEVYGRVNEGDDVEWVRIPNIPDLPNTEDIFGMQNYEWVTIPGGITEPPGDGDIYGRSSDGNSGTWRKMTTFAEPDTTDLYARRGGEYPGWVKLDEDQGNGDGIGDCPDDGDYYVRVRDAGMEDGFWEAAPAWVEQDEVPGTYLWVQQANGGFWDIPDKADVGLGNVENVALSTWAGSRNLTTAGLLNVYSLTSAGQISGGSLDISGVAALRGNVGVGGTLTCTSFEPTAITVTKPGGRGVIHCDDIYCDKLEATTKVYGQTVESEGYFVGTLMRPRSDGTRGWEVRTAGGSYSVLSVDTLQGKVNVGTSHTSYVGSATLDVLGTFKCSSNAVIGGSLTVNGTFTFNGDVALMSGKAVVGSHWAAASDRADVRFWNNARTTWAAAIDTSLMKMSVGNGAAPSASTATLDVSGSFACSGNAALNGGASVKSGISVSTGNVVVSVGTLFSNGEISTNNNVRISSSRFFVGNKFKPPSGVTKTTWHDADENQARMTLDAANGRVGIGIGNISPAETLDVAGTCRIGTGSPSVARVYIDTGGNMDVYGILSAGQMRPKKLILPM